MANGKMTPKQEMFVREYLIDLNATQAAIRAGYKGKNVDNIGSQLLGKTHISHAIAEANDKRKAKLDLDAEYVLRGLINVAERCQQAEPVMQFNYKTKEMEETGEYKFDSIGANKALELLGKHLKLFTDKVERTDNVNITIVDDIE